MDLARELRRPHPALRRICGQLMGLGLAPPHTVQLCRRKDARHHHRRLRCDRLLRPRRRRQPLLPRRRTDAARPHRKPRRPQGPRHRPVARRGQRIGHLLARHAVHDAAPRLALAAAGVQSVHLGRQGPAHCRGQRRLRGPLCRQGTRARVFHHARRWRSHPQRLRHPPGRLRPLAQISLRDVPVQRSRLAGGAAPLAA